MRLAIFELGLILGLAVGVLLSALVLALGGGFLRRIGVKGKIREMVAEGRYIQAIKVHRNS